LDRNSFLSKEGISDTFKKFGIPMSSKQLGMLVQPLSLDSVGDYNYIEMLGLLLGTETMLKL
jgi:hypothetical protein